MVAGSPNALVSAPIGPVAGVRAILAGMKLTLTQPRLRRRLVASMLANGLAFLAFFALCVWGAFALTAGLVDGVWYAELLGWLARALVIVGLLLVAPVVFAILADILLPIFHGPVFDAARQWAGAPPFPDDGGVAREVKLVALDLRRLAKFLALSALLLLLNFVPLVGNLAYLALQFGLAAHTMGWDLLAYHFEGHNLGYADQRRFVWQHLWLVLAIGAIAEVLCLIPLAQFFFVTTNVAGAGILSAKLDGIGESRVESSKSRVASSAVSGT